MKREERRASRREDVQRAALRIVAAEGLSALTIQRVAKEVSASVGGLYRYYPSKEAMIGAVAAAIIGDLAQTQVADIEACRARWAPENLDRGGAVLVAELLLSITVYTRLGDRNFEHQALLNAVHSDVSPVLPVEGAVELDVALEPLLIRVIGAIMGLQVAGTFSQGDAKLRAFVLWGTMFGVNQFRTRDRFSPPEYSTHEILKGTFESLIVGFGATREIATRSVSLWDEANRALLAAR